jgi:hypothetical protein
MAVDLYWDDDSQTRLLCVFDGRWTWDELRAVFRTISRITRGVDHEVSAIIDLRRMQIEPGAILNADGLAFAREIIRIGQQGAVGPMAVVGASPVIATVVETLRGMDPSGAASRIIFVESLRRARELLDRPQ